MPAVRELLIKWGFEIDEGPLKSLESSIGGVVSAAKVAGAAVVGAAGTLFGLAESARSAIDDLDELAQSAGVNTQFFAEFSAAAKLGGASVEDTAAATARFSKSIVEAREGSESARDAFRALGISQEDLNRLPTEALLAKLANGLQGVEDPAKRVALAQELLGKSGRKLLPSLVEGADGLAKLGDEAREFGLVPGPEAIKAANDMELAMARAKGVVAGLGLQIGTALMPVVTDVANEFAVWAKQNREVILSKLDAFVSGLTTFVRGAWEVTTDFVDAMRSLVQFFRENEEAGRALKNVLAILIAVLVAERVLSFVSAMKALVQIIRAANVAIAANPIGLLLTLLAVLVAVWVANWSEIKEVSLFAWEAIKEAGRDVGDFLVGVWNGFLGVVKTVGSAFVAAWQGYIGLIKAEFDLLASFVRGVINGILAAWDKAKGVVSKVAGFLGFGGDGNAAGHSPGRPGSPESRLTPLPTSSGIGGAMAGSVSRSVNVTSAITISVPAGGMAPTQMEALESRVRRAAREEFERATREAIADMG